MSGEDRRKAEERAAAAEATFTQPISQTPEPEDSGQVHGPQAGQGGPGATRRGRHGALLTQLSVLRY